MKGFVALTALVLVGAAGLSYRTKLAQASAMMEKVLPSAEIVDSNLFRDGCQIHLTYQSRTGRKVACPEFTSEKIEIRNR